MINNPFTLPKYRTLIFLVVALPVLYFISRHNYNLFHSFADGASIVIAACVFTIIWNGRRIIDNEYFLCVGIAFLFFAFWDLIHLLGNKNMGVFPQYGNLGPTLYIVSRYFLSISLIIAPLFINRKINTTLMFAVYSLVTLFILLSIFYWNIFPVCIVEGKGLTPFKVVSDYIICLILLGAIGLLFHNRRSFDSRVLWLIVSSLILSIATGLAFTLYADPFGIMNAVGHFFQIASFYLIYLAFIETSLTKPQDILYRKLKQNEEMLAKSVQQLDEANVRLKQEIAERKRIEEDLRENKARLDLALWSAEMGAWHWDIIENKRHFDDQVCHLLGINPGMFTGTAEEFFGAIHPDDRKTVKAAQARTIEQDMLYEPEYRAVWPDGSIHYITARGRLVRDDLGQPIRINGIIWDITDHKLAGNKIKDLLAEKELLLQEVHHRIKNNMNVIMSLLSLQSSTLKDPSAISSLKDARSRVQSMMVLYDKLYRSGDFRAISAKGYLAPLIDEIVSNFPNRGLVTIEKQIDDVVLDAKILSPIGMVLNELLTNAMKHAFTGREDGLIRVSFSSKDNHATLFIQDNGLGIPESIDIATSTGFGMQLVEMLTEQLQGSIRLERKNGLIYILEFDV